jgi:galactose mutarotase-like enzyme
MKYGLPQVHHRAFCVETQAEPNAVNFDGNYLKAGEVFNSRTIFRLSDV